MNEKKTEKDQKRKTKGHVPEAAIISTFVCTNDVFEAVLGTAVVTTAIRQDHSGAAHAKEAIRNEHRPITALVPIISYNLRTNDDGVIIRVRLKHIASQIDCNNSCTTSHSAQIVTQNIPPHLVVVDDHGGERRRRIEDRAIDDKNSDVLWTNSSLLEKLVESAEHDGGSLRSAFFHGGAVIGGGNHRFRNVGFIADSR